MQLAYEGGKGRQLSIELFPLFLEQGIQRVAGQRYVTAGIYTFLLFQPAALQQLWNGYAERLQPFCVAREALRFRVPAGQEWFPAVKYLEEAAVL